MSSSFLDAMLRKSEELLSDYDLLLDQLSASAKKERGFHLDLSLASSLRDCDGGAASFDKERSRAAVALTEASIRVRGAFSGRSRAEMVGETSIFGSPVDSPSFQVCLTTSDESFLNVRSAAESSLFDVLSVSDSRDAANCEQRESPSSFASNENLRNRESSDEIQMDSDGFKKPKPPKRPPNKNAASHSIAFLAGDDDFMTNGVTEIESSSSRSHGSDGASQGEDAEDGQGRLVAGSREEEEANHSEALDLSFPRK